MSRAVTGGPAQPDAPDREARGPLVVDLDRPDQLIADHARQSTGKAPRGDDLAAFGILVEPLASVLADRLKHVQPAAPAGEKLLREQRLQSLEGGAGDLLRRGCRRPSSEGGHTRKRFAFLLGEQALAPLDDVHPISHLQSTHERQHLVGRQVEGMEHQTQLAVLEQGSGCVALDAVIVMKGT